MYLDNLRPVLSVDHPTYDVDVALHGIRDARVGLPSRERAYAADFCGCDRRAAIVDTSSDRRSDACAFLVHAAGDPFEIGGSVVRSFAVTVIYFVARRARAVKRLAYETVNVELLSDAVARRLHFSIALARLYVFEFAAVVSHVALVGDREPRSDSSPFHRRSLYGGV